MRLHEPHFILDRVESAHADQHRLLFHRKGGPHKIGGQGCPVFIGDFEHFTGRVQVPEETVARLLHQREGREAPGIIGLQEELGLAVVIGGASETVDGSADMSGLLLGLGAREVTVGNPLPFHVPAFLAGRVDARSGLEYLADRAAAFLGFAQAAPELVGKPGRLRPVVPPKRLVMRQGVCRDPIDRVIGIAGLVARLLMCHIAQTSISLVSVECKERRNFLSTKLYPIDL